MSFGEKTVGLPCHFGSVRVLSMSVQEIKEKLAILPRNEQDEVIAFLFQLRHSNDSDYQSSISRRLQDKDRSHWLSPDEFERELDKKERG